MGANSSKRDLESKHKQKSKASFGVGGDESKNNSKIRLVLLGAGGVGKSCLTIQYTLNMFVEKYDPTIQDTHKKPLSIDGQVYTLEILDTAGTGQFDSMRDLELKEAEGYILVYSITGLQSFNELPEVFTQICHVKDTEPGSGLKVPMILVGTKSDMPDKREVLTSNGQDLSKKFHNCEFLEASAKTGVNVEAIFEKVARQVLASRVTKAQ